MLGKGFFLTESHNPDLPPENYDDLVYENTTAGSYSETLSWGKYKIVISGAGGGGAAAVWNEAHGTRYAENGYNGEEKVVYVNVFKDDTLTVSGTTGSGGTGGRATPESATRGTGGTGYQNGSNGTAQHTILTNPYASAAGGGGGGSTSLEFDSVLQDVAAGGNGGTGRHANVGVIGRGGTGGSGGATTGTGATGGIGKGAYGSSTQTGGTGTDGYIRIYKSNLKPEPI